MLRIIPLGGVGEIGKNIMVFEYGDDALVVDAGLMFPDEEMLGIDLVLPDFTYLKQNAEHIRGIILTHGHEDHIGAVPYLLRELDVPIYGTRLTLGLLRNKLIEHSLEHRRLIEVAPGQNLRIGEFEIEFIQVCHSIPDGLGLAIRTPLGLVLHTGDFKLDQTPIDGRVTDCNAFAACGQEGVLAMLSDSTNAEVEGMVLSERAVGETLKELLKKARGKAIVTSFASHIHRIQQVVTCAQDVGRKVAFCGRNMLNNVKLASDLGYLEIPPDTVISFEDLPDYPSEEIVILSTGSQGEPLSALRRIAYHEHRFINIVPGDMVIISARPVPGNEKSVQNTINQLFKCGAEVYYEKISGVHVSGHAAQEELKFLLNMVKPRYFMPIHGEYRHLRHHARLAEEVGIDRENIFILENGIPLEIDENGARRGEAVPAGMIFVDGLGFGDTGDIVLRDRKQLSKDGIFIVVACIDRQSKVLIGEPDIISRGFAYIPEGYHILDEVREELVRTLRYCIEEEISDWIVLKGHVRDVMSTVLFQKTRRRPMIIPIIMEM
jgi:ribonuclease J